MSNAITVEAGKMIRVDGGNNLNYRQILKSEWDKAQFFLKSNSNGPIEAVAVNIEITGRTAQKIPNCGVDAIRVKITFLVDGDGEETTVGGWMLLA